MNAPLNSELDESTQKNRFVFIRNKGVPSLQEMTSFQVALVIWNGYISRCSANKWEITSPSLPPPEFVELLGLYYTYQEDTDTLVESLQTPRKIETILKISLKKVCKQIRQCIYFFSRKIPFLKYCGSDRFRNATFKPHWFVWLPNGEIDYLKMAEIMVSSENNELDLKTKIAVMCDFYMEEKLKSFPLDSFPADFFNEPSHSFFDFRRYWIKYLTGESEETDTYRIVAYCRRYDDLASIRINHFWHRLSDDDQVRALYHLLLEPSIFIKENWQAVESVLGSMSWDQQRRLLSMPEAGEKIIAASCLYSSSSKCAVWAWKHCRDFITAEQFRTIVEKIFRWCYSNYIVFATVTLLWDLAFDYHRDVLVTIFPTSSICMRYRGHSSVRKSDYASDIFVLLNKCLPLTPMDERKALIMNFAIHLVNDTQDSRHLQKILHLYLPNHDDQIDIKKYLMISGKMMRHCAKLFSYGYFDILNVSVEFFCDNDLKSIRKYCQKLLSYVTSVDSNGFRNKSVIYSLAGDGSIVVITDIEKWRQCCELIDKTFLNHPTKALVAKKNLVSHFLKFRSCIEQFYKHFGLVVKIVESVFSNESELNNLKIKFIKSHFKSDKEFFMREDICNDVYFHSMMEWCCDNNNRSVMELKNQIQNHDTIFDIVFFQLNKVYVTEEKGLKLYLLTRLDKYLSWYLASEDEILAYKKARFNEFEKMEIFTSIFKQTDNHSLKLLLAWFFLTANGDEMKLRGFLSKK